MKVGDAILAKAARYVITETDFRLKGMILDNYPKTDQ